MEWSKFCNKLSDDIEISKQAKQLMEMEYSIHFHTWTVDSFLDFICRTNCYSTTTNLFEVEFLAKNNLEIIVVLKKA
jgi:hypothetical protein